MIKGQVSEGEDRRVVWVPGGGRVEDRETVVGESKMCV